MVCSFYFYDVYDRHNYLLNFGQKLRLSSDIYFCMDIMTGTVKEDILISYFGRTWPGKTNRIAGTSIERTCQIKNVTFTNENEMMNEQSLDFITDF